MAGCAQYESAMPVRFRYLRLERFCPFVRTSEARRRKWAHGAKVRFFPMSFPAPWADNGAMRIGNCIRAFREAKSLSKEKGV